MYLIPGLLLTHILADFLLLPGSWSEIIEAKRLRTARLYIHFILYGAVSVLVVRPLTAALIFAGMHALVRLSILHMETNARRRFFLDLSVHGIGAIVIGVIFGAVDIPSTVRLIERHLGLITAVLFLTKPASVIIRSTISRWNPDPQGDSPDSLEKAGTWIGILERLFVFLFVLSGQYSAVGFLLAAKSVFRFGDLREAHDRKLTEYILIGTLLSVGIALATALVVQTLQ